MPSTSKKQHNFMAAVANNPAFAKKVGVPQSVGKEFNEADTGRKFSKGGDTMASKMNPGFLAMMAKKKGAPAKKMAGGGMHKMPDGMMMKDSAMKHGGSVKKMANGGMSSMGSVRTAAPSKDGLSSVKTKGTRVKMSGSKPLGMKSGGKTC